MESFAAGWDAVSRARNEDHVGAGRELLELHRRTEDERFLDAARKLAALNESFPSGANGERYHRGDTPGWRWQIWVDCMDVDGPFLAALAHATGEERYFDQAVGELLGYARTLQDNSGLLFHGFERDCGQKRRVVGARQWLGAHGARGYASTVAAHSCCVARDPAANRAHCSMRWLPRSIRADCGTR